MTESVFPVAAEAITHEKCGLVFKGEAPKKIHFFFDIDGTLTDDRSAPQINASYALGNAIFEEFCYLFRRRGVRRPEAIQQLEEYALTNTFWDYSDFIYHFQFSPKEAWERLREWHARHIQVYQDGIDLVMHLHRQGHTLHIVSNNPLTGCLLKLEVAGLGGLAGTPWFSRIFCSNTHRGQKHSPAFWNRIFIGADISPEQAFVVGNDWHEDFEIPFAVGSSGSCIVDRSGRLSSHPAPPFVVRNFGEFISTTRNLEFTKMRTIPKSHLTGNA